VEELDLSGVKCLSHEDLRTVAAFTALRRIKMGEPNLNTRSYVFNSALEEVLTANPGIEELEYQGSFYSFIYDCEGLRFFFCAVPNRCCGRPAQRWCTWWSSVLPKSSPPSHLSPATLRIISNACPGLKVLKVKDGSYDHMYREYGTSSITTAGFMSVVTACPNLEVLEFRNTPLLGKDATATHDGLTAPLPEIGARVLPRCHITLPEAKRPAGAKPMIQPQHGYGYWLGELHELEYGDLTDDDEFYGR